MWSSVRILFGVLAVGYIAVCGLLFFFQRSLMYHPRSGAANSETTLIALPVNDARVLVCARPKESARALIYFGGNAEDVSLTMASFSAALPDRALYLLHYRGYGGSSGSPSQDSLFADGLALFDQVHARHSEVELVGRSLGTAVALYVASRRPAARLVLITPFDSITDAGPRWLPYILPLRLLVQDRYESWRFAPLVQVPTLIMAASDDEIIPRWSTELLRTRFKDGLVTFKVLPGTGHNTIQDNPEFVPLLRGVGQS